MKICTNCGKEKELNQFHKRSKNKLNSWCKECVSIYKKKYYKNNKEERKLYRDNHKERDARQYKENKKHHLEIKKEWRKNNSEKYLEICKKATNRRKRELGFNLLNKRFPGSVGHHINRNDVIYIPEELHRSIPHSQNDLISMEEINMKAKEYLQEELYAL